MLPFSITQLPEDLRDRAVLDAMERVPRKRFVPVEVLEDAESDVALAIGFGQTISQPYIVAYMTAALRVGPGDRVLEVGTGSGYQAAVLAEMDVRVYSIELLPALHRRAAATLEALGYLDRVQLKLGDGRHGWRELAPYDAVIVTASPRHIPPALIEQTRVGGRLVIPVGERGDQELRVLVREERSLVEEKRLKVRFVPLVKPELSA